jgi:hypothetical protein
MTVTPAKLLVSTATSTGNKFGGCLKFYSFFCPILAVNIFTIFYWNNFKIILFRPQVIDWRRADDLLTSLDDDMPGLGGDSPSPPVFFSGAGGGGKQVVRDQQEELGRRYYQEV